jgi:hypothetical protein
MTLVNEQAADDAGSAVHVFVVTPCGEIDIPVVKFQRDVANGVG